MSLASFKIYNGTPAVGAGTLTVVSGSTAGVGVGTAFGSQVLAGDVIVAGQVTRSVAMVTDATHWTWTLPAPVSASGLSYIVYRLVNVETLAALLPPLHDFKPYSKSLPLGDTTELGTGWATAAWKWGWISVPQRNLLKALCPFKSVRTFIQTPNFDRQYIIAAASLIWPEGEDPTLERSLEHFEINFRAVVQV